MGTYFGRNTRFEVCLVISVDPDQVLHHAASGRSLYLYCSQVHLIFGINITINGRSHTEREPGWGHRTGSSLFHFFEMYVQNL